MHANAHTSPLNLPLTKKSVLVLDPHRESRRSLQEQVSCLGATSITSLDNCAEAEKALAERNFDLILCEYELNENKTGQHFLEEMRTAESLAWDTVFMMVTSERRRAQVLSVAEFEPDDYLIKPFAPGQIVDRIHHLFRKKEGLKPLWLSLKSKEPHTIGQIHSTVKMRHKEWADSCDRMVVEFHLKEGALEHARAVLTNLDQKDIKPWAQMIYAKLAAKEGDFQRVQAYALPLVEKFPHHLPAVDLLAQAQWELNQQEQALKTWESAGLAAQSNAERLRKMSSLSMQLNDRDRAMKYLSKVVQRGHISNVAKIEDVVQLTSLLIERGDIMEAQKLNARLPSSIQKEEALLARQMMDVEQKLAKKDREGSTTLLEHLFGMMKEHPALASTAVKVRFIEMCFDCELADMALHTARTIAQKGADKGSLDRLKRAIEEARQKGLKPAAA